MVKAAILTLAALSQAAHAYVTVLSSKLDQSCTRWLLEKSTQGIQISLEDDPTQMPPVGMSLAGYTMEVLSGVEKVRSVYSEIFRERKMDPAEAEAILNKFAEEDEQRLKAEPFKNGLGNTVYFVRKNTDGSAQAVVRATFVRAGEGQKLPLESRVSVPDTNRIELERAYNGQGPRAAVIAQEMMYVMARYFKDHLGRNRYTLYNLTDAARARHYRQTYGFSLDERPEQPALFRFLCHQTGENFFERYVGHVEKAYKMAFGTYAWAGREGAIEYLKSFATLPGLHDYVPNLKAQAVIYGASRDYAKAAIVSEQLKKVGAAEINEDYYALWTSRAQYDPFKRQGDAAKALDIVRTYLSAHPIKTDVYNDRALLFLIYELKIYLSTEDWDRARGLIRSHKLLLRTGRARMSSARSGQWNYRSFRSPTALRKIVELVLDLSTGRDYFATSVLSVGYWNLLFISSKEMLDLPASAHYEKVAALIKSEIGVEQPGY